MLYKGKYIGEDRSHPLLLAHPPMGFPAANRASTSVRNVTSWTPVRYLCQVFLRCAMVDSLGPYWADCRTVREAKE